MLKSSQAAHAVPPAAISIISAATVAKVVFMFPLFTGVTVFLMVQMLSMGRITIDKNLLFVTGNIRNVFLCVKNILPQCHQHDRPHPPPYISTHARLCP